MTTVITLDKLLERLKDFLYGGNYETFRTYVFSRYEAESEITVDDNADEVLSVLAPYIETEEAIPDQSRDLRLRRTARLLANARNAFVKELCVFGLNFSEIVDLTAKVDAGIIPQGVYMAQLRRLTPAEFDVGLVADWARKHRGNQEPDLAKLFPTGKPEK